MFFFFFDLNLVKFLKNKKFESIRMLDIFLYENTVTIQPYSILLLRLL